ncbi:hypothetical protein GF359_02265 [candidate division WOR-3 bacterium]|uniref:Uncharacterized protein n=1 Tax=candidate division WOR-3 bacterium TaxID=2052148 RepID=A0A9D5QBW2_UNCW3|nr:hypothetical protein [candidate division WOR-3 bacterium]MBD3364018.1 hypothetical protein [candidate division WOR-3 bacterium]
MKSRGLLIALIISVGINLGAIGTLTYYFIRKTNPKLRWKQWTRKYDKTWKEVQDSLDIGDELTEEIRGLMKEGFEESRKSWDEHRIIRDSIIDEVNRPELDTGRLRVLIERDMSLQTQTGVDMYERLFKAKSKLPSGKQEDFIEFYKPAIHFTGQPWYLTTHKERKLKPPDEKTQ